ncbi:MAG: bestrophin family protein [Bacteroidia bacterium]
MIVSKDISFKRLLGFTWYHIIWLLGCAALVAYWYDTKTIEFEIPWLPVSVIGTAVAFYVGFKNNQAYDRMWEARKIWGAIVNSSRSWGMMVDGFVNNQERKEIPAAKKEIENVKETLIYRHIGWLYTLRAQLLVPAPWEHINQSLLYRLTARKFQKSYGIGLVEDEITKVELKHFLPDNEYDRLLANKNTATQIINEQSRHLAKLRDNHLIDDFRHMEMEKMLVDFYTQQGKCERIKKFPFPRQYANVSRYFIAIFIIMLHFSMIPALQHAGNYGNLLSIPITALIGWVYVMMEIVADYSENPFQGMANDIPMLSLTRTIEIDLREMLGETDLPEPIASKKDILM